MTIHYATKNYQFHIAMRIIFVGVFVGVSLLVFLYSQTIGLRTEVRESTALVESLRVENADLKNVYYATIDSENLIAVAGRLGLVKDRSPNYLNLGEAVATDENIALSANVTE